MAEIRRGRTPDFPLVMDRVVASFREGNPGHLRFEVLYPDAVRADDESMFQWRLAFVNGELAAGMQIVPRPMTVAGCVDLAVQGVGNVFCYPTFRKQGLMSDLLRRCIAEMTAEGAHISMLGGDRTRYGQFGWEHAGASRQLTLSARVTRHQPQTGVSGVQLRTWTDDPDDAARMRAAYQKLPYRTQRSEDEFARVLQRPNQVVWIADSPEQGFAYMSLRPGTILEYAGDAAALETILAFLLANGSWSIALPPGEGDEQADAVFMPHAQFFQVAPTAMIRIMALCPTLAAYLPLLHRRLEGWNGAFTLEIDGDEAVTLRGNGRDITVERAELGSRAELVLGRRDMARLLFGPFPPAMPADMQSHPVLRRIAPLPVYWHALAHV